MPEYTQMVGHLDPARRTPRRTSGEEPELYDRVILEGSELHATFEDVSDGPGYPKALVRFVATDKTEWVALDSIRKA